MFNNISHNINYSLTSQLLSCHSVNDNGDANSKDIHKIIDETCTTQTNTISVSNKEHQRKINSNDLIKEELEQAHILIAEAENELLVLFRDYLSSLGINTDTVDRGDEALDRILEKKDAKKPYDAIVVDTHLTNPSGIDVAKRIHSEKPDQKIVLITTTPRENLPKDCLKTAGIEDKDILTMPFKLSKLRSALTKNLLT